jgi:hypothetical protein
MCCCRIDRRHAGGHFEPISSHATPMYTSAADFACNSNLSELSFLVFSAEWCMHDDCVTSMSLQDPVFRTQSSSTCCRRIHIDCNSESCSTLSCRRSPTPQLVQLSISDSAGCVMNGYHNTTRKVPQGHVLLSHRSATCWGSF